MQLPPPCSAPTWWLQLRALGVAIRHAFCGLIIYLFIFPPGYVALWDSKIPHRPAGESVSWCLETSLLRLPSRDRSPSPPLLSLFLSFIFCPNSFWRKRAAFLGAWCPLPAFRNCFVEFTQCSNVIWWICGGESGFSILYLCHLRTDPNYSILYSLCYIPSVPCSYNVFPCDAQTHYFHFLE